MGIKVQHVYFRMLILCININLRETFAYNGFFGIPSTPITDPV